MVVSMCLYLYMHRLLSWIALWETLDLGLPDRMMVALGVVPPPGGILLDHVLVGGVR
jgi:hypothetical protein